MRSSLGGAALAVVLDQRGLHDADQSFAVGRDGQAFHAFVGGAAGGVAADLVRAHRAQDRREKIVGQLEGSAGASR